MYSAVAASQIEPVVWMPSVVSIAFVMPGLSSMPRLMAPAALNARDSSRTGTSGAAIGNGPRYVSQTTTTAAST